MPATLQDIAEAVGVSVKTVSNVLNGRNKEIWPSAAQRAGQIRQVADRLGYRPNASARATRSGRFHNVTLLLGLRSGRSTLPSSLLGGVHDSLVEHGYSLGLVRMRDEELADDSLLPRVLREANSDGLLIDYTHDIPPHMLGVIQRNRLPAIWINTQQPTDCVYPDDAGMGALATQRLLDLGHRRIAYFTWSVGWEDLPIAHYSQRDRQAGYEQTVLAAGLAPQMIRRRHSERWEDPIAALCAALSRPDGPTAIVTYSPDDAQWVTWAAREVGLAVPKHLSLVSFNPGPILLGNGLRASVVLTPEGGVGRQAVKMLLKKIAGAGPQHPLAVPTAGFFERSESAAAPDRSDLAL